MRHLGVVKQYQTVPEYVCNSNEDTIESLIIDAFHLYQDLAAFTATSYSFDTHKASTVWNLMDLKTGEVSLLYNGSEVAEMVWIGPTNTSVLYVNGTNREVDGGVELWVSDTSLFDKG